MGWPCVCISPIQFAARRAPPYASEVAYKTPSTSKVLVVALGPMAHVRAPEMIVDPAPCSALVPTTERKLLLSVEISEVSSDGEISEVEISEVEISEVSSEWEISEVEISEVSSDDGLLLRHARGNS